MDQIRSLIDRCRAGDPGGWERLWSILDEAVLPTIRRRTIGHRYDPGLAEDIRQELLIHLLEGVSSTLGNFRGDDEAQFRCYMRRVADRFATKWLRRWRRSRDRELGLADCDSQPDRAGPTEGQFLTVVEELRSIMDEADRGRLESILDRQRVPAGRDLGARPDRDANSPRTIRHWRQGLYLSYAWRVI